MLEAAVGLVLDETREHILLVQRKDAKVWVLPGGGIDPEETAERAAIREIQEETGLNVSISRLAAVYSPINRVTKKVFVFECVKIDGELGQSEETKDVRFFPLKSLPTNLFFVHRDWIADVISHPNEKVEKRLTQVTYSRMLLYALTHPLQAIAFLYTFFFRK